ncbi:hypothetical protein MIND_01076800 [Mycena indigotica]|uniref:Uncharacterized protein n=1 Tax=Mycena indigotica TaxID=2126181 RepID=A0A8H6SAK6_9AGAR|nr:uncharacterized protein MIND_01076800 [Mycena indigotica]KAF7295373.1 hypothetical protein MIND_01076800 [Mycena indigotica]
MHSTPGRLPEAPPPATTAPTMLDPLDEISLKDFPPMAGTPTSATMSLPTPECQPVTLPHDSTMQNPPDRPVAYFIDNGDAAIVVPGAPLMKDYDSFTEGSKEGSFASLPAADVNEFGDPIYPISAPTLAALPHYNSTTAIHAWRLQVDEYRYQPGAVAQAQPLDVPTVSMSSSSSTTLSPMSEAGTTPTNAKRPRPRSTSSEEEGGIHKRNTRARPGTPPTPSPRIRAQSFGTSGSSGVQNSFLWVELGPPPNVFQAPRPPSRANSAPD